jgi:voltage-gated potassium channel
LTAMPRKKGGEVTPRRLSDLEPHRRRAVVIRAVVSIALMWVASLTVYYLAPIGRAGRVREGLWLVIGLLLVGVLVFRRTRQILAADFPGLRAVEGLAVILALSQVTASSFSQELDHTRALYFAITVFATVGFGDITPTTNTARIIVSIQMLLDLVLIAWSCVCSSMPRSRGWVRHPKTHPIAGGVQRRHVRLLPAPADAAPPATCPAGRAGR